MRKVEDDLIVGVTVNRGHRAALNPEIIVNNFGDWREAVRRAGGIRNNVVLRWIVFVFVYAQHNREVFILCGRRNNDLLYRPAQVLTRIGGISEAATRFHDYLRA